MPTRARTLTLLGVFAVLAGTGTAFTAASSIDAPAIVVGSVEQQIAGATITDVRHTYSSVLRLTTALTARAEELVSTAPGVVTVEVNGGAAQACTVTHTDLLVPGVDEGPDYSTFTCDIVDTSVITSLRFVVNG